MCDSCAQSCASSQIVFTPSLQTTPRGNLVDGLPRAPSILTKIKIARPAVVRSALKPSQAGFDMYRFGWCRREVEEHFKVLKMYCILAKVVLALCFACF